MMLMDRYYRFGETIKDYYVLKILGEGRYGIAYLAKDKFDNLYVIKQLKKNMLKSTRSKLFYESEILKKLDDPRFPKFITNFNQQGTEGFIMEYKAGTVFEDLIVRERYQLSRREIYDTALKLVDILYVLQKKHIVHRDIRLPNVIITSQNTLVLIDFGLARYIDNDRYVKQMDYWYLGDFLIHLYFATFPASYRRKNLPWYKQLPLTWEERTLLMRLVDLKESYEDLEEIREDLFNLLRLSKVR